MQVLVYNIMFNKMAAVSKACTKLNAEIRVIKNDEIHIPIEELLTKTSPYKENLGKDNDVIPTELLLFDGFSSYDIDLFLEEYNYTNAPKILYKALVTPINRKWTPSYLYKHLQEEVKK